MRAYWLDWLLLLAPVAWSASLADKIAAIAPVISNVFGDEPVHDYAMPTLLINGNGHAWPGGRGRYDEGVLRLTSVAVGATRYNATLLVSSMLPLRLHLLELR